MRRTGPSRGLVLLATTVACLALGALAAQAATRGWLGVYTQTLTEELRSGLDYKGDGVLVNGVVDDSPADKAGLRKGDIIVAMGDHGVTTPAGLSQLVSDAGEGKAARFTVVRDGDRRTFEITLGLRDDQDDSTAPAPPEAPEAPQPPRAPRAHDRDDTPEVHSFEYNGDPQELREKIHDMLHEQGIDDPGSGRGRTLILNASRGRLGVRIETVTEDLASALGESGTKGALVLEVIKDTPAEKAGLKAGDVLTAVEGKPIDDSDDLRAALRDEKGKVSLTVVRRGSKRTVEAELKDAPDTMHWFGDGKGADGLMGLGRMGDGKGEVRMRLKDEADHGGLQKEIDELREQLRELRQKLEDSKR